MTIKFPSSLILGALGIVFVTLKLTDHIDWSWWWVTAPFWGPMALIMAILIVLFFWFLADEIFKSKRDMFK